MLTERLSAVATAPTSPAATGPIASVSARGPYLTILSLLAVSFMLFQIAVLRELRYQLSTVFTLTPFLFSGVLAFIGLGSLAAGRIAQHSQRVLGWAAVLLPLLLLPLFLVVITLPQVLIDHAAAFSPAFRAAGPTAWDAYARSVVVAFLAVAVVGYGPIFFLQGVIFTLYFREGRQAGLLSNVYAVDLIASGIGALAGAALTWVLTPVEMVLAASALLVVTLWIGFRHLGIALPVVSAVSLLVLSLAGVELATRTVSRLEVPAWLGDGLVYSQWSRYRHVDLLELPETYAVFADRIVFGTQHKDDALNAQHPRSVAAGLARSDPGVKDVLILGAGTGADVRIFRHLVPRDLRITAVELDGGFVEAARTVPALWNAYRTADIVVQEGRYFLENSPATFDLILYSYVEPQTAISDIGLPDAHFMHTDSGLRRAYEKLRPGGYLVITRIYIVQQADEFIRGACATLKAAGVSPGEVRLYRSRTTGAAGFYGDGATLYVLAKKGGTPPEFRDPRVVPVAWADGGQITTDYFPLSVVTGLWLGALVDFLQRSPMLLLLLAAIGLALVLRVATSVGHLNFFLLGYGSFLLESLVLFNSFLLLGDPNLSAAVAVGAFLIWNGVGSLLSRRLEASRWFFAAVPFVVLLYAVSAPLLNALMVGLPLGVRTLVFCAHMALGAIVAGAMFPIALRRFADQSVSRMFFIDLVGCAMAPLAFWVALSLLGLWVVGASAVVSYAVVGAILLSRRPA
jgi:spermidine synthase